MSDFRLTYDIAHMRARRIGKGGLSSQQEERLRRRLEKVRKKLKKHFDEKSFGFLTMPDRLSEIREVEKRAKDIRKRFSTLIVVGIGGSDLGARALISALKSDEGMDIRFIGSNTDPDSIALLLQSVNLKRSAINIISKSGMTLEPMSTFLLLRDRMIKAVGKKAYAKHIIATTDEREGTLRQIADEEGYYTLPIPNSIGGRFSALTPVGLFPALCAGVSIKKLLSGARIARTHCLDAPFGKNSALTFAVMHHEMYLKNGRHITVLMPYSDKLKDFGEWFRQLWAESLGKRRDRKGHIVFHGLTPIAALGATDQHSQIQLYNDGPDDKVITFIEVNQFDARLVVPTPFPNKESIAYMGGVRFDEIIHAERFATAFSLAEKGRPNGTIFIPRVDAESVGSLMMIFMIATAAMGELLDIDAYNQPGVEDGKRATSALLGRKGFHVKGLRRQYR